MPKQIATDIMEGTRKIGRLYKRWWNEEEEDFKRMGIKKIGRQLKHTVGNWGRLYWKPRFKTDCSVWGRWEGRGGGEGEWEGKEVGEEQIDNGDSLSTHKGPLLVSILSEKSIPHPQRQFNFVTQLKKITFYIQLSSDPFGLHDPHRNQSRNDLVLVWGIRKSSMWLEVLTHVSRQFAFFWDVPRCRMWNRSTKPHGVTLQKKQFLWNVFLSSYIKSGSEAEYNITASLPCRTLVCHPLYFLGMGWRCVPVEMRPLMGPLPVTWYRSWVSNLRPARLIYAARGHICKQCIHYKNYVIIRAVRCTSYFSRSGARTRLQEGVWHCAIKRLENHGIWTWSIGGRISDSGT